MRALRNIAVGLLAGSLAVLCVWITRVVLPPRECALPEVIKLDTMDAYAARPSHDPSDLLAEAHVLERVVDSFEVSQVTYADAVRRLAEVSRVNIVLDPQQDWVLQSTGERTSVSMSLRNKTVDQILERLFDRLRFESPEHDRTVWYAQNGVIFVSQGYRPEASFVLRMYDVKDLMLESLQLSGNFPSTTQPTSDKWDSILHGSEQEAAERLKSLLGIPEGWNAEGEIAEGHYFAGRLLIRATREGHGQVRERLELLRTSK